MASDARLPRMVAGLRRPLPDYIYHRQVACAARHPYMGYTTDRAIGDPYSGLTGSPCLPPRRRRCVVPRASSRLLGASRDALPIATHICLPPSMHNPRKALLWLGIGGHPSPSPGASRRSDCRKAGLLNRGLAVGGAGHHEHHSATLVRKSTDKSAYPGTSSQQGSG